MRFIQNIFRNIRAKEQYGSMSLNCESLDRLSTHELTGQKQVRIRFILEYIMIYYEASRVYQRERTRLPLLQENPNLQTYFKSVQTKWGHIRYRMTQSSHLRCIKTSVDQFVKAICNYTNKKSPIIMGWTPLENVESIGLPSPDKKFCITHLLVRQHMDRPMVLSVRIIYQLHQTCAKTFTYKRSLKVGVCDRPCKTFSLY